MPHPLSIWNRVHLEPGPGRCIRDDAGNHWFGVTATRALLKRLAHQSLFLCNLSKEVAAPMVRQYGVQVAQLFAAELAANFRETIHAVRADARTRTPGVELVQLTR